MISEVEKLQVLNDLIAQTLDVINQRNFMGGGITHTPYTAYNQPRAMDPRLGFPVTASWPREPVGFSHSPWTADPRNLSAPIAPMGYGTGLSHSSFDPRLNIPQMFSYGIDPRVSAPSGVPTGYLNVNPLLMNW